MGGGLKTASLPSLLAQEPLVSFAIFGIVLKLGKQGKTLTYIPVGGTVGGTHLIFVFEYAIALHIFGIILKLGKRGKTLR